MERCDFVNDDLRLIQDMEGLTFGTDALLLAGYVNGKFKRGVELGSGSGIISMLLLTRGKVEKVTALEVQEHYADLTRRNTELNGLTDRMECLCTDVREYIPSTEAELVFTNPPYMKTDSVKKNLTEKKNIARHEVNGDIYDFCKSARKMLKFGGNFVAVYRPDRLIDLIDAMRSSKIEPKRMTLVYADTDSEPSMALIEGKAGGRSGLLLTKPLIIYRDSSHKEYTDDMNYIMENGSFPSDYKR
jgi:tRNA1(Val) A37 N6-methylase TrmN6